MKNTTIPFAINKSTNKKIYADQLLDRSSKDYRSRDYICYYCKEPLDSVVNENNPNIQSWFRHKPYADCVLQRYSKEDKELDRKYLKNIESERHKQLKKGLRIWLSNQGAEKVIEERRIYDDSFFYRKPDIYCEYQGKKIAFEIQVSKLSYKSLKRRSEFFKQNNIYCIWIVDWFDPDLTQGDYDFKEHNPFENIFSFNLELTLLYVLYIEPSSQKDKWKTRKFKSLNELNFDHKSYQAYFYNTPFFRKKIIDLQIKKMNYREKEEEKANEYNKRKEQEKKRVIQYLNNISSMDIANEIKFISQLEYDYTRFSKEAQKYFFAEIAGYSHTIRGDYNKPFLNNLIYYRYGLIVEFLLTESPIRLYVDGNDESNISIWQQLVGWGYGFTNDEGYIDLNVLVPLINKHTKNKQYTIEEVESL